MTADRTFLFADIEGSSHLWEQHPADMVQVIARHMRIFHDTVADHGGRIVKETGDGIFAIFPDERSGVLASLGAQLAFHDEDWGSVGAVRVRMGLHAGEAIESRGDYYGPVVNRCARIAEAAHGAQIIVSETVSTVLATDGGIDVEDLGHHRLRDLEAAEHLFQVLHPALPRDFPPVRSLDDFAHNLPAELSTFIGRSSELEEVSGGLAATRLLTLVGPGGVGKTRLAFQVAADVLDRFPGGVWVTELGGVTDPGLVAPTVAAAVRVPEEVGRPATARLVERLAGGRALLVLDNCEHLLDPCATLIDAVLRACSEVTVLATSREALTVPGETVWNVLPLMVSEDDPGSEAVALFVDRARAVRGGLPLPTEQLPAIVRICRRLDGLPLAIELAAARVRALSVEDIADRLDDRFPLLTGGSRTALPRQQTLEAAVAWSYDLLNEDQRRAFEVLSAFAGRFPLAAVEAVVGTDGADLAVALVERSLLVSEPDAAGRSRFRMLETIRAFARERLGERGEKAAVLDRHLAWCRQFAERAARALDGPEQLRWFDLVEDVLGDLRAAMDWALGDGERSAGVRIASALYRYWYVRGVREGREWLERLQASTADLDDDVGSRALYAYGSLVQVMGEYEDATKILRRSVDLFRETGNDRGLAYGLHYLGRSEWGHVTPDENLARFEEALALFEEVQDPVGIGLTKLFTTLHAIVRGDLDHADRESRDVEHIFRTIGAPHLVAHGTEARAWATQAAGAFDLARRHYLEATELYERVANRPCSAHCIDGVVSLLMTIGDHDGAAYLFGAMQALRRRIGVPPPPYELLSPPEVVEERLLARLSPDELASVKRRGAALPFRDALAEARALLASASAPPLESRDPPARSMPAAAGRMAEEPVVRPSASFGDG